MKLLAIELSTRRGSIALFQDRQLAAEESWDEPQARHGRLFDVLPRIVPAARDVDVFAVGRGPGSFSGIRVAVTAAQAMALPFEKNVVAISSGEALARAILRETRAPRVAIIGDARRGTLWFGIFTRDGVEMDWSLTTVAQLDSTLPSDAIRVSPDWERLQASLRARENWIEEPRFPAARDLGEIALRRLAAGAAPEPVAPIYMHPPV